MAEMDKQAGVGRALRTYIRRVTGREVGSARSDIGALHRVSEIASNSEVPKLLHADLQKARDALELAKIKQFDSRATTGLVGATGLGAALIGGHEYFQRQRQKDLDRYYQRPLSKYAGLGSVARTTLKKTDDLVRHARGGKINDYLDANMGWSSSVRKQYLKSTPQQQASLIDNSVKPNQKRQVLRDLGKLHARRRAARAGIATIGGTTIGTSYAVKKNRQKEKRRSALQEYLPERKTEFYPTVTFSESPHYFKGDYQ